MALTQGQKLHGFTVDRVRHVDELGGDFVELTHDKTGAQLCWMDNGEINKLFCVGFKTIPEDSTGVFHILEHSVLCGSEKYPVREPFLELMKSSMSTFLNAMTFPDKTIYPVSSRNEQDFLNLTEVYLDAVFAPSIFKNPGIFQQEGWHIDLPDENATPTYKGVVFNEMKGAMSSPDDVAFEGLQALVYPDSCYGFNSGGDPKHIPDLTYHQFLKSYCRYYHPSNSRIFLDGDIPLDRTLEMIDGYLSRYERLDEKHDIADQTPKAAEATISYELGAEEPDENRAILMLGKIVGSWKDIDTIYGTRVLCRILAGSNEAPLKRAILSAGLAQDMEMEIEDGIQQPLLVMQFKNIDDRRAGEIRQTVRDVVNGLLEKGLDRAMVEAEVNRFVFQLREPNEPQGLIRAINSYGTWLYGGDPLTCLLNDPICEKLIARMANGGYEALLKELLGDESTLCVLHVLPSKTLGEETRKAEAERLQKIADAWTPEDKAAVLEMNRKLAAWQQTPDTPEQLATLPVLDLKEISPDPLLTKTTVSTVDGVTVLQHQAPCRGIVHINLYFDLADRSLEELTQLALLGKLLGKLPTDKHDAVSLQREINTHLGRLWFGLEAYANHQETSVCTPRLWVNCSVLKDKLPAAIKLMHEVLTQTRFDEPERVREIVLQEDQMRKQYAINSGDQLAAVQVGAHFSARGAASEAMSGHTYTQWLHSLVHDFDARYGGFAGLAQDALGKAVCRSRMTVSVTSAEPIDAAPVIDAFLSGVPAAKTAAYAAAKPEHQGIRIPAQIGYAGLGGHLSRLGASIDGSAQVAATVVGLNYLWNKVRVQGGAYGVHGRIRRSGDVAVTSFRDPTPGNTLNIFRGIADFLGDFIDHSDEPLDKFIIGTISNWEPLVGPRQTGIIADNDYFSGITDEKQREERRQMLSTTRKDLRKWREVFDKLAENAAVCVVGNDDALAACQSEHLTVTDA